MAEVNKLELAEMGLSETVDFLTSLDFSFSSKFSNRRDKIVFEINAFTQAVQRQIIPAEKRNAKIAGLEAEIERLKQEVKL